MAFNFTTNGNNFSSPDAPVSALSPVNTGIESFAQRRLDNIISRANAQYLNALAVDAVPLNIWARTLSGVPCTCCRASGSTSGLIPAIIDSTVTINDYSQATVQVSLPDATTDKNYKIIRVTPSNLTNNTNDAQWTAIANRPNLNPSITTTITAPTGPTVNFDSTDDQELFNDEASVEMGEQTHDIDSDMDAFFASGDSGALFGGDKHACGICFSTGLVEGYTLVNGKRIVLDASSTVPFNLQGADIDRNSYPAAFSLPTNVSASVVWSLELPAFCLKWINVRPRNNLLPASGVYVEYATIADNYTTWNLLTLDALNSTTNANASLLWQIRARVDNRMNIENVKFTHIELLVITANPTLSQTPNFVYNVNFETNENSVETQFDVAPNLLSLPRESVFTDLKYGLCWKVTSVTPQMTSKLQVFGYQVVARMVQRWEQMYLMHTLYTEVPTYLSIPNAQNAELQVYDSNAPTIYNENNPTNVSNYTGIENVQGEYGATNRNEEEFGQQVDDIVEAPTDPFTFIWNYIQPKNIYDVYFLLHILSTQGDQ